MATSHGAGDCVPVRGHRPNDAGSLTCRAIAAGQSQRGVRPAPSGADLPGARSRGGPRVLCAFGLYGQSLRRGLWVRPTRERLRLHLQVSPELDPLREQLGGIRRTQPRLTPCTRSGSDADSGRYRRSSERSGMPRRGGAGRPESPSVGSRKSSKISRGASARVASLCRCKFARGSGSRG